MENTGDGATDPAVAQACGRYRRDVAETTMGMMNLNTPDRVRENDNRKYSAQFGF